MFLIYLTQDPPSGGFVSYVLEKCNSHIKTLDFLFEILYIKFTMNLRMPIVVSGVAGAGKDLFFQLLSKQLPVRRFALADQLKRECSSWCLEQYGIDPLNCSREEKEKVREFLVYHGTFKRKQSEGRHWVDKLTPSINSFLLNAQTEDIPVVTDIRYQEYDKDEVAWLRGELGGVLVHITQYVDDGTPVASERPPVNSEETRNDPIIKSYADFLIKWPKIKCDNPEKNEYLMNKVKEFVIWYNEKGEKK